MIRAFRIFSVLSLVGSMLLPPVNCWSADMDVDFKSAGTTKIVLHDIFATDYQTLLDGLENTIINTEGRAVWAYTAAAMPPPAIKWSPGYTPASATELISFEIHRPNWVNKNLAPTCLQAAWDQLDDAITVHENGHIERFLFLAQFYQDEAKNIPASFEDEKTMYSELDTVLRRAWERVMAEQTAYDLLTDNGVAQGMVLKGC